MTFPNEWMSSSCVCTVKSASGWLIGHRAHFASPSYYTHTPTMSRMLMFLPRTTHSISYIPVHID